MATSESAVERPICPNCGHENIAGAVFCAQCGQSLNGDQPEPSGSGNGDSQTTSVFEPVTNGGTMASDSPWAPSAAGAAVATDPGQTSALPVSEPYAWERRAADAAAPVAIATHQESRRGFVLGLIATLIIATVLVLYWYWAWIGDSTRDSIEGWLPWVS
jgi:hypothetical protein